MASTTALELLGDSPNTSFFVDDSTEAERAGSTTDAEHIALYIMLTAFSVIGTIGNAIAFYIFFKRRNSTTSVIFILALAGTDFITCLITIPFTIAFEAVRYQLQYDGLCKLYMFFITSTIPYSSFIMAGIAFDRYFCICHPFLHVLNVGRARLVVLCLALPAFALGIITGMFHGLTVFEDELIVTNSTFVGTNISVSAIYNKNSHNLITEQEIDQLRKENLMDQGFFIETDQAFKNETKLRWLQTYRRLISECAINNLYFSETFITWYTRLHTSCYILCFFIVVVLYILIYKFIFSRRAMKVKRRKKNYYTSVASADPQQRKHHHAAARASAPSPQPLEAETAMTELSGNGAVLLLAKVNNVPTSDDGEERGGGRERRDTATTSLIEREGGEAAGVAAKGESLEEEEERARGAEGRKIDSGRSHRSSSGGGGGRGSRRSGGGGGGGRDGGQPGKTRSGSKNSNGTADSAGESSGLPKRCNSTAKDRNLYANVKTALMLFVVTLVFLVAFAPACIMAQVLVPMQLNVFYMYFVYNVVNPFIYAFMNQAFREDLKKLLKRS